MTRGKSGTRRREPSRAPRSVEGKGAGLLARLAAPLLERPGVGWGTMMGFPCLRAGGSFFASVHHRDQSLIVKLPEARVKQAVAKGEGQPFAPAGRVFKEWLEVPLARSRSWKKLLAEAHRFVSGQP